MTCDGIPFHRRTDAVGNALSPMVDSRVRRTTRDIDDTERNRYLASVSADRCSSSDRYVDASRVDTGTPEQRPCAVGWSLNFPPQLKSFATLIL